MCDSWVYLWIKEYRGSIEDQGVLHHEIDHFVDYAFTNVGIPTGIGNTEVRAYYGEYIYTQCLRELDKLVKATAGNSKGEMQGQYDKRKKSRKRCGNPSQESSAGKKKSSASRT
jgi:hypothetical protein